MMRRYAERTVIAAMRRVLRMVDGYIEKQFSGREQDCLITDGRDLTTWREIRRQVTAAAALKCRRIKPRKP